MDQYLFASRAPVHTAPIMVAHAFCTLSMLSNPAAKIWTGVNILRREIQCSACAEVMSRYAVELFVAGCLQHRQNV